MVANLSQLGREKIKELKINIYKKKIMLNFIIDNYSAWDKGVRYIYKIALWASPILTGADQVLLYNECTNSETGSGLSTLFIITMVVAAAAAATDTIKDFLI